MLPQDDNQLIYKGFAGAPLQLFGAFVEDNGLLQLTHRLNLRQGHAFYRSPIEFNTETLSFLTNFVFSIAPVADNGGHGLAFVITPAMEYIVNVSDQRPLVNHILAVELDTVESRGNYDINDNHVGIDVDSLVSVDAASASYFSDVQGKNISLKLDSGKPLQLWIEYNGTEKLLNVTLAPAQITKPSRPLLSIYMDLSKILWDSKYVGFTAATGRGVSEHYVLGWSFNTTGPA